MNLKMKYRIIIDRLEDLYPNPPIPLNSVNSFTFLVAVVLSAQCTDKKVNEVTSTLFKIASNSAQMKSLGVVRIYNYINQLGLARQKAKYLYELSTILEDKYDGNVPASFKDLEALPGVGHKTASVVLSKVFGIPTFPVDTHIHRLAQRWELTNGISVKQTETDLKRIFPKNLWNKLHLQFIYYGREHCSARGCDGTKCIICKEIFPNREDPVEYKRP